MTGRQLRQLAERLDARLPLAYPYVVKLVADPGNGRGWCSKGKRRGKPIFVLAVVKAMPDYAQREALIHEFSHAMDWREPRAELGRERDHDARWGLCYGLAYSVALDS